MEAFIRKEMTLEEAIEHCYEVANKNRCKANSDAAAQQCARDHLQLGDWLRELLEYRGQQQEWKDLYLETVKLMREWKEEYREEAAKNRELEKELKEAKRLLKIANEEADEL